MTSPTLLAELTRELCRTPALRELLAELAPELDPAALRPVLRTLLLEDVALGVRLLALAPRILLGLVSVGAELGRAARRLPAPLAGTLLGELGHELRARLRSA